MNRTHHLPSRVAVIGVGAIGTCLVRGLTRGAESLQVFVSDPSQVRLNEVSQLAGVTTMASNREAVAAAEVVILAIAPKVVPDVLVEIGDLLRAQRTLVVSLAASISYEQMQSLAGEGVPLVAGMPNTPIQHCRGVTGLHADGSLASVERERVSALFSVVGQVHWLADQALFSSFAAIAGCGPAYYFLWSKLLVGSATALGLDPSLARDLVGAVATGAAWSMAQETGDLEAQIQEVATPGGVTEKALQTFAKAGLPGIIDRAVRCAEQYARPARSAVEATSPDGPPSRGDIALQPDELAAYREHGFVQQLQRFQEHEAQELRRALLELAASPSDHRFLEDDGTTLRSYNGAHLNHELVRAWATRPEMLVAARELVGGDVYLYQTRFIYKAPFTGAGWPWHQDFRYWMAEDRIQRPDMVLAAVFLDDVSPINSPLMVLPGSQRGGMVPVASRTGATQKGDFRANLGTDGEFSLSPEIAGKMIEEHGCKQAVGPLGSVLFLHPNLVHGSYENISGSPRGLMYFVYNRVDNAPAGEGSRRPPYLCATDHRPLQVRPFPGRTS